MSQTCSQDSGHWQHMVTEYATCGLPELRCAVNIFSNDPPHTHTHTGFWRLRRKGEFKYLIDHFYIGSMLKYYCFHNKIGEILYNIQVNFISFPVMQVSGNILDGKDNMRDITASKCMDFKGNRKTTPLFESQDISNSLLQGCKQWSSWLLWDSSSDS